MYIGQRTLGSVLQTALSLLEAIRFKKNGTGLQGEIDLTYHIISGDLDLEAEEWCELVLDSVMVNFTPFNAAVDLDARDQTQCQ